MNELKGKFVNIVLSVEEGRGFDLVKCPFYLTASFHGRKMDSDIVEGANVVFSTEMVWETEKKHLRKVRGSYTNIRLECLTSERKLLGFTLLCLRSAKVVPIAKARQTEVVPTWTKLVSVPNEFKKSCPELSVFLIIRDYVPNIPLKSPMQKTNTTPHLPKLPSLQFQQVRVPVKYADEGFIQLGNPEDCSSKFQLKVTLLIGSDLDVLLPESMIFGNGPKSFHLSVDIFGLDVKTRRISDDVYAPIVVFNEAIVINLQSSFDILGTYFKQFSEITVKFYAGNEMLAMTQIDMTRLNLDLPEAIFYECKQKFEMEQVCFFEGHYRATCSTEAMRRATISTECKLEAVDYFQSAQLDICSDDAESFAPEAVGSPMSPAGDGLSSGPVEISLASEQDSCALSAVSSTTIDSDDLRDIQDHYHQFLLEVKVESIVWKASVPSKSFTLKLIHPLVDNLVAKEIQIDARANEEIRIEGAECSLSLVSLKSRLNYMMMHYTPKVELYDSERQEVVGRMLMINFSRFYIKRPGPAYNTLLVAPSGAELASLYISILAKEMSLMAEPPSRAHLFPCILDETVIMHSLKELTEWHQQRRQQFEENLLAEKADAVKRLGEEFRTRTLPLREDLLKNLEKCRAILKRQEKRKQVATIDHEVSSLVGSQEYSIIMEIHKNTIKFSVADKQELIEAVSELEVKNSILLEMLSEQALQMQELKETQLTTEQTKILLRDLKTMEEKYEIAQQDKNYFKREYEKAMKEVHNLKVDYHKNIASKIFSDKQALNIYVTQPALDEVSPANVDDSGEPTNKTA